MLCLYQRMFMNSLKFYILGLLMCVGSLVFAGKLEDKFGSTQSGNTHSMELREKYSDSARCLREERRLRRSIYYNINLKRMSCCLVIGFIVGTMIADISGKNGVVVCPGGTLKDPSDYSVDGVKNRDDALTAMQLNQKRS